MTARRPALPAAIVFAVVLIAGSLVAPAPPGLGASGSSVLAWAHNHGDAIRWQAWLVMLSSLAGGALVALVHRHVGRGPEATAYLVGAVVSLGVIAVATLIRLALARTADPAQVRLLADLDAYWAPLVTFPIALQAGALAVAARRGTLPRWVGAVSLVLLLEQLAESATIFGSHGFFAPGGSMNTDVGPTIYVIWIVAQGAAVSRSISTIDGSLTTFDAPAFSPRRAASDAVEIVSRASSNYTLGFGQSTVVVDGATVTGAVDCAREDLPRARPAVDRLLRREGLHRLRKLTSASWSPSCPRPLISGDSWRVSCAG